MARFIDFSFDGTDIKVINHLQFASQLLQHKLVARMTALMTRIQFRLRAKYNAGKYSTGELAESVTNPRAEVVGGGVVGRLDITSPVATYLEDGTQAHTIYPKATIIKGTMATRGKAAVRRQVESKAALHFYSDRLGKNVFADYVFKDPISGRHYVKNTLTEMQDEIRKGIQSALEEVMAGR